MKLPSYIVSRLKADRLGHDQAQESSGHTLLLRQWLFMLSAGVVLLIIAGAYAAWRFNYWSSIEENVAKEEVSPEFYDRSDIESILREFDDKAVATRLLLDEATLMDEVTTSTTSTTTEPALTEIPVD